MSEREDFEKWAELYLGFRDPDLTRQNDDPESYIMDITQHCWLAWSSRAKVDGDYVPIVWIDPEDVKRTMIAGPGERADVAPYRESRYTMPLYTHPAKTEILPEIGSHEMNEAAWRFIESLPYGAFRRRALSSPEIKAAIHAAASYLMQNN